MGALTRYQSTSGAAGNRSRASTLHVPRTMPEPSRAELIEQARALRARVAPLRDEPDDVRARDANEQRRHHMTAESEPLDYQQRANGACLSGAADSIRERF